jgi:hypothetical protein
MSSIMRKFKIMTAGAIAVLGMAIAIPAAANASGESADMDFSLTPKSGSFFKDAYRSADWNFQTTISTPDPVILPMKVADLSLPPNSQMTFNPPNDMPVCPDSQVGPPPVNVSVPVETVIDRCPDSVIGNGTAVFVLNRNNHNPAAALDGYIVAFNGGKVNGQARVKIYAFSYDTGVGIYTEGTLSPQGDLAFNIPQLTSDSSVSNLNISLPGKDETYFLANQQISVKLPAGQAPDYVQARCESGSFDYAGSFELGTRDTDGTPISPTTVVQDQGSVACTGAAGKPKLGNLKINGPSKTKRNKKTTYKIKVKNAGTATAKGVKLKMSGKGVSVKASVGNLAAGKTKTVKLKAKFKKKGKIKVKVQATSKNAGSKAATKKVNVK